MRACPLAARRALGCRYERIRSPRSNHSYHLALRDSEWLPSGLRERPRTRDHRFGRHPRALTEESVEMEFLTDDPVAQAVTYQRVTFDARAPRCGR
jgi:hypothetical protein